MIIRLRTAFVTCLLLFILMEDASLIPVKEKINYEGILKKLEARPKKSVQFDSENECERKLTMIANTVNYHSLDPPLSFRRHTSKAIGFCNI